MYLILLAQGSRQLGLLPSQPVQEFKIALEELSVQGDGPHVARNEGGQKQCGARCAHQRMPDCEDWVLNGPLQVQHLPPEQQEFTQSNIVLTINWPLECTILRDCKGFVLI